MNPEHFYIEADQQTSGFIIKIINAKNNSVFKTHGFSGTIVNPPVLSGDIVTFSYKSSVTTYLAILNIKTGQKREKVLQ
jgi:hypothetical protein